jgi:hypothetical protein
MVILIICKTPEKGFNYFDSLSTCFSAYWQSSFHAVDEVIAALGIAARVLHRR